MTSEEALQAKLMPILEKYDVHDLKYQLEIIGPDSLKIVFGTEFFTNIAGLFPASGKNDMYIVSGNKIELMQENKMYHDEWITEMLTEIKNVL